MKFYTKTHQYYCGIDLHARNLYVCILDSEGAICVQKNIELGVTLIGFYDEQLSKMEWHCHKTAKAFDYQRLMLRITEV